MKVLAFLLASTVAVSAADFTVTVNDQDALDAVNTIIAVNGSVQKPEDVIASILVPLLVTVRQNQLQAAANAAAANDPAVVAFQQRQAAKVAPVKGQ